MPYKISDLTSLALASIAPSTDCMEIVDVSDTTTAPANASGSNKKVTVSDLVNSVITQTAFTIGATSALLRFGGATSSFPALRRSTTSLEVRLADDSAYTGLMAGNIDVQTGAVILRGGATNGYLAFNNLGSLRFASDGVARLLNDAATDFGRLQFGGTTSSFPALKRSSAALQARLADDSAYADFYAATHYFLGGATPCLRSTTAITSGAGAATGTLTNAPSAGNPTCWIPINDNGTTRYFPAW